MMEMAPVKPVAQADMEQGKGGFHRSGTFGSAGMRITIKNLSYSVADSNNKGQQLYLLKNVNGFFEPGQMAALVSRTHHGYRGLRNHCVDALRGVSRALARSLRRQRRVNATSSVAARQL